MFEYYFSHSVCLILCCCSCWCRRKEKVNFLFLRCLRFSWHRFACHYFHLPPDSRKISFDRILIELVCVFDYVEYEHGMLGWFGLVACGCIGCFGFSPLLLNFATLHCMNELSFSFSTTFPPTKNRLIVNTTGEWKIYISWTINENWSGCVIHAKLKWMRMKRGEVS